jgi:hypothetical protein
MPVTATKGSGSEPEGFEQPVASRSAAKIRALPYKNFRDENIDCSLLIKKIWPTDSAGQITKRGLIYTLLKQPRGFILTML